MGRYADSDERTRNYKIGRLAQRIECWPPKPEVGGSNPPSPAMKNPDTVFNFKGRPVEEIKTSFHSSCRRASIKNLRFHDLRHTFATRLVLSGIDLATVSKLLGHSTIHMTMRYSHPTPEALKSAVSALDSQKSEKSVSNYVSSEID